MYHIQQSISVHSDSGQPQWSYVDKCNEVTYNLGSRLDLCHPTPLVCEVSSRRGLKSFNEHIIILLKHSIFRNVGVNVEAGLRWNNKPGAERHETISSRLVEIFMLNAFFAFCVIQCYISFPLSLLSIPIRHMLNEGGIISESERSYVSWSLHPPSLRNVNMSQPVCLFVKKSKYMTSERKERGNGSYTIEISRPIPISCFVPCN